MRTSLPVITPRPLWRSRSRSEEHTSELQSQSNLVCRLLLEKKKKRGYVVSIVVLSTFYNSSCVLRYDAYSPLWHWSSFLSMLRQASFGSFVFRSSLCVPDQE